MFLYRYYQVTVENGTIITVEMVEAAKEPYLAEQRLYTDDSFTEDG